MFGPGERFDRVEQLQVMIIIKNRSKKIRKNFEKQKQQIESDYLSS